jgi:thioredoxin reductase
VKLLVVPAFFAVGDVRGRNVKRVVSAVGERIALVHVA